MAKSASGLCFDIGCKSVEGISHRYQDRVLVDRGRLLFAVADGLTFSSLPKGGEGDGGIAAQMAVNFVRKNFNGSPKDAILGANSELVRTGTQFGIGGETTITIAFIDGERLYVANVGDSPAYLLRNGRLCRIYTQDKGHFGGLSQALGHDHEIIVHERSVSLRIGDLVAIASDGALKVMTGKDLSVALNPKDPIQVHVDALIRKAEDRRGNYDDDKSLILIRVLVRD